MYSDINECATSNGGCETTCTNTDGSFTCSCDSGFQLNGDGLSCDGNGRGGEGRGGEGV